MPTASFLAVVYHLSTGARVSWGAADGEGRAAGAAPSGLDAIPNVGDINIPITKIKTDVTTRKAGGWKAYKGTLKDVDITIPQVYDNTDTGWLALQKAWLLGNTIALAFLEGDKGTAGVEGLWGDFEVLDGEKGEKIDGVQMFNWKVAPGWTDVPNEWIIVTS